MVRLAEASRLAEPVDVIGDVVGAGQIVAGRYRLDEVIGSGGMGTVWRATDQELNRVVALKRARSEDIDDTAPDEQALRRLRREARIAAELTHPHVVAFLDVVPDDWQWWLVMEYVPSRNLGELVREQGPLDPRRAALLGAQVADALATVHAKGVQHRDVTPGNVLVAEDGTAKLADFGIARAVHGYQTQTGTGLIPGTPGFLAPEVAEGNEPGPASDVFSLGATLFAAVEGHPPVGEVTNPLVAVRRAAAGKLLSPRRAGVLAPVLGALLRVRPADRPDAAEAARLLGEVAEGRIPVVPAGRRARRRLVVLSVVLVSALLATVVVLVLQYRPATSSGAPGTVGDPRTADPCALTDPVPLRRGFADAKRNPEYGNFDRCDVIVSDDDGPIVDVDVHLVDQEEAADDTGPVTAVRSDGPLITEFEPPVDDECSRRVRLPDGYLVSIAANLTDDQKMSPGDRPTTLCAMADTATTSAVAVLRRSEIPRRAAPFDGSSLGRLDACALLDDSALATAVPRLRATDANPSIGNWKCRWSSSATSTDVTLRFDRDEKDLSSPDDGAVEWIAGRRVAVEPSGDSDDGCVVRIAHREYSGADAKPVFERLQVDVRNGGLLPGQLCEPAKALAAAAISKISPAR